MSQGKKTMPYVRLGNSGLKVSKIILGCMSYGSPEWQTWVLPEEESIKHVKAAYVYSNGLSEIVLGKAIKQLNLPRDEIVVLSKVYFVVGRTTNTPLYNAALGMDPEQDGYVNQHGLSRKLERLQLDYIDVLQCHRFDQDTPIEETMQALHDVVQAGYVRYIGMSSCYAWQFHAMQNYAISNKLTPFISMQNHYSLVYREEEREMFPTLKHFGVGSIPWSPLARGLLTRPLSAQTKRGEVDRMIKGYGKNEGTDDIVNRVEEIASKRNVSMAQIALAWVLSRPGAVNLKLTEEELKALEEPYKPQAVLT
ncbi:NADP-dependent oxidoreductase domain-containing protein [Cyathus striatus]|nr:NADP-dependent oxidoreductase domain-containing protein [Cyathus striatus]